MVIAQLPSVSAFYWAFQNVASGIVLGKVTFVRAFSVHSFVEVAICLEVGDHR